MAGRVTATPVFEFTKNPNPFNINLGSWVFGQKFTVGNENIIIDSLGYFDDLGDGFIDDHEVGIFTEAGELLTSTTVNSSDTFIDHFRYSDIDDLELFAGQQYRLVAVSWSDNYQVGADYTVDPRIIDNGSAYYSGTTLGIGNNFKNTDNIWVANFNIKDSSSVPEPSTMLLLGSGIAGLAGIRIRRKKHHQ